jgi:hypothetical protein
MVSRTHYNLIANEYFVIFFTSKLITCFRVDAWLSGPLFVSHPENSVPP